MYEDEFEETLEADEADSLRGRRGGSRGNVYRGPRGPRPRFRMPGGRRVGGPPKCPPGTTARYDRGWKCKPDIVSTMPVIMPQFDPRWIKQLEWVIRRTCGSRSVGRGITWGKISPEVQRIPITQRREMVARICGKKPPLKLPQDKTLRMLKMKLGALNEKISKATTRVRKLERERDAIKSRIEQLTTKPPMKKWTFG